MAVDTGYAAQDGSAAAPAYTFNAAKTTGWFRNALGHLCASVAGVQVAAFTAAGLQGAVSVPAAVGATGPTVLTSADAGKTFVCVVDAAFTLPLTTTCSGARIGFLVGVASAGAGVVLTANGADTLNAKTTSAGTTAITGAATLTNTPATDVVWDRMELVSDGVSKWIAVAQSGVWA